MTKNYHQRHPSALASSNKQYVQILNSYSELASTRQRTLSNLALVPTMGALHEGHLSLVREARKHADKVIVSIFVNPTQFGPSEDFSKYPRDIESDLKKLEAVADYVYLPTIKDIYPGGEKITAHAGEAAKGLDGDFRPGHFDGVCTVVSTLFDQIKPDTAIFGEKDYQQLIVIKEMNYPDIKIIGAPILREPDGLAMSSRNIYLSPEEIKIAPILYSSLRALSEAIQGGAPDPELLRSARNDLESKGFQVQYLQPRWNRLLVAAYLGKTRLIDNIPL